MNAGASPRIKLCIVNPFQHGGGAEYQISCLVDVLVRTGRYEIYYLARYTDANAAAGRYRVVQIGQGGLLARLSSRLTSILGYRADARSLNEELEKIRPDVIYQRVAGAYTGICARYAKRHGARLVWHIAHDSDVSLHSRFYATRNKLRGWLEKSGVKYAIEHATRIVAQKVSQSKTLAANYGRPADAVIPNFHPEPTETIDKSGQLTVVWVANLKTIKRPDAFVRLASALRDLTQVRFVMVGPEMIGTADREWGDKLKRDIGAAPNLKHVGPQTQAQVNQLLATSHLFVNTSEEEGFPNTFIQAWMRAVPVVSLSVDPDGVLGREEVGMLGGTEAGLAEAVRRLISDDELRNQYAARARHYALANHSTRNAERLERLLATGELPGEIREQVVAPS
jgi:glycosyltransferase involved in cell wall biosynthesis